MQFLHISAGEQLPNPWAATGAVVFTSTTQLKEILAMAHIPWLWRVKLGFGKKKNPKPKENQKNPPKPDPQKNSLTLDFLHVTWAIILSQENCFGL